MNEQKQRWQWVEKLIAEYGERAVAAVMGFDALEDFAQCRREQRDIDAEDMGMLRNAFKKKPSFE